MCEIFEDGLLESARDVTPGAQDVHLNGGGAGDLYERHSHVSSAK